MKWINVRDRLPEINAQVLLWIKWERGDHAGMGYRWGDESDWGWAVSEKKCLGGTIDITHWMPLPEGPKEDYEGGLDNGMD